MSTVIHRLAPTRVGCPVTLVCDGVPGVWRRTRRVIASGATHAAHTLTAVRVNRRSTGPATRPGSDATANGDESSGTRFPHSRRDSATLNTPPDEVNGETDDLECSTPQASECVSASHIARGVRECPWW